MTQESHDYGRTLLKCSAYFPNKVSWLVNSWGLNTHVRQKSHLCKHDRFHRGYNYLRVLLNSWKKQDTRIRNYKQHCNPECTLPLFSLSISPFVRCLPCLWTLFFCLYTPALWPCCASALAAIFNHVGEWRGVTSAFTWRHAERFSQELAEHVHFTIKARILGAFSLVWINMNYYSYMSMKLGIYLFI